MKFKIGDRVRILGGSNYGAASGHIPKYMGGIGWIKQAHDAFNIQVWNEDKSDWYPYIESDLELLHMHSNCLPKITFNGESITAEESTIELEETNQVFKPFKKENKMNVVNRIKDLAVNKDEKLLRKFGLKDEHGEWTTDAVDVLDAILLEERKDDLIAKVRQLEAEDKKSKDK